MSETTGTSDEYSFAATVTALGPDTLTVSVPVAVVLKLVNTNT
ncbi:MULTISPECIES: hypothetical protein [unclassified Sulfurimonas]|nr:MULTISPECIES: hypothetical protein [unclassified Sulfurimonas]